MNEFMVGVNYFFKVILDIEIFRNLFFSNVYVVIVILGILGY